MRSRGSSLSLGLTAAGAPGQTAEESFSCTTYSIVSARICLGLADFLPFGICVLGQVNQLAEVLRCLLAVAGPAPQDARKGLGGCLSAVSNSFRAAAGWPISSSNSASSSRNG